MKIFFVGIHYKKGLSALDKSTKSGKILHHISNALTPYFEVIFTNLIQDTIIPSKKDIKIHAIYWHHIYNPSSNDIIILLGKFVKYNFKDKDKFESIIEVKHPASLFGINAIIDYNYDIITQVLYKAF
jgi:hypothetical protein